MGDIEREPLGAIPCFGCDASGKIGKQKHKSPRGGFCVSKVGPWFARIPRRALTLRITS